MPSSCVAWCEYEDFEQIGQQACLDRGGCSPKRYAVVRGWTTHAATRTDSAVFDATRTIGCSEPPTHPCTHVALEGSPIPR